MKNAAAELPYGGAKSLILHPGPIADRRAAGDVFLTGTPRPLPPTAPWVVRDDLSLAELRAAAAG